MVWPGHGRAVGEKLATLKGGGKEGAASMFASLANWLCASSLLTNMCPDVQYVSLTYNRAGNHQAPERSRLVGSITSDIGG